MANNGLFARGFGQTSNASGEGMFARGLLGDASEALAHFDMADPSRTARIGVMGRLVMAMCLALLILGVG